MSKENPQLEREILNQAFTFLQYVSEYLPERQLALTKHYMWLAVVFLTAHTSMFFQLMQSDLKQALNNPCFVVSVIAALLVFVLGIVLSSGLWFKRADLAFASYKEVINCLDEYSNLKLSLNKQVELIIDNVDSSIKDSEKILELKGKFLRAQCLISLIAFIFGIISFLLAL